MIPGTTEAPTGPDPSRPRTTTQPGAGFPILIRVSGYNSAAGDYLLNIHPMSPPCPGDLDGSGTVDTTDLNIILSAFGCVGPGCAGDIDGAGDTDTTDLNILLSAFGAPCP